jgi:hypothetical protein
MFEVCNGGVWLMPYGEETDRIVRAFEHIARRHGSKALWLPLTGVVATSDINEVKQALPYEEWRLQAITKGAPKYLL